MKRVLIFMLCTGFAAVGAFMITRWAGAPEHLPAEEQLEWLKAEFQLSKKQAAEISVLQDNYQPVCREHCQKIQAARSAWVAAKRAVGAGEKAVVAQAELARVEGVCREATRAHFQRVAAVMEPAQGERFLALVLPKLGNLTHDAPCELK